MERGVLLGLPVAALPVELRPSPTAPEPFSPLPCRAVGVGDVAPDGALDSLVVLDLSALWAGPLCTSLLAQAGARVIKVESTARPDGARRGPPAFFDLLNGFKESVALDLQSAAGRASLRALIKAADVVVESSRPRALAQLGIDADDVVRPAVPDCGFRSRGTAAPARAAIASASVTTLPSRAGWSPWDDSLPVFCADAVADPAAGLVAAAACLDALAHGGRWLIDVSLAGVAAHLAGPTLPVPSSMTPAQLVAPQVQHQRQRSERHRAVLAELG